MTTDKPLIVLAGATGNLGGRVAAALVTRGADVRAIVRPGTPPHALAKLKALSVAIAEADYGDSAALADACEGAGCVVSALSGLREVVVDAQTQLLNAAVAAGVRRFIPSDYCIDFTKLPRASNRNLDLRRDFHAILARAPVAATSVFNGAFADILTGQAPIILFSRRRVLYWGDAGQVMDFTTIDDTAAFTASAALERVTPRFLRIAGDRLSARDLATVASEVAGREFKLLRAGSLNVLALVIRVARRLFPAKDSLYPPWQGMQYLHNMFGGNARLEPLDNVRYPGMRWTPVRTVLAEHLRREAVAGG